MSKKRLRIFSLISLLIVWSIFVALGFIQGYLLKPLSNGDRPADFIEATHHRLQEESVGNLSMLLIENGQVAKSLAHSTATLIDEQSIFPVASISKLATSLGIFKLVEQGKIDLDTPVDDYINRWHLPPSDYDNKQVTIRRLLSHSSGLIDDLGYAGFEQKEEMQSLEESLTQAKDSDYSEGRTIVGYEPGSQYMYSGGGFTLLQLIIEETTGMLFEDYMQQEVFRPLAMGQSTFDQSKLGSNSLVPIYQVNGEQRKFNWFTAQAAASLLSSTSDLAKLLLELYQPKRVISKATQALMMEPNTFIGQTPVYALGPHLYSQGTTDSFVIGHDGSGNAINSAARIDLISGNGIIVLETGHYSMASSIADEWLFWKTGVYDFVVMKRNQPYIIGLLVIGYLIILTSYFVIARRKKDLIKKSLSV